MLLATHKFRICVSFRDAREQACAHVRERLQKVYDAKQCFFCCVACVFVCVGLCAFAGWWMVFVCWPHTKQSSARDVCAIHLNRLNVFNEPAARFMLIMFICVVCPQHTQPHTSRVHTHNNNKSQTMHHIKCADVINVRVAPLPCVV